MFVGCAAAIAAGEAGSNVLLLEPTGHVGGMATEGGIGLRDGVDGTRITDPRNSQVRWGKLNALHYGYDTFTVWQPDNAVGEKSFIMLLKEAGVEVSSLSVFESLKHHPQMGSDVALSFFVCVFVCVFVRSG